MKMKKRRLVKALSREIKFRAWDPEAKAIYECVTVGCSREDQWPTLAMLKNHFIDNIDDQCILMQYTGVKTIDGTEIYEGDIVYQDFYDGRTDGFTGEVKFCEGAWWIDNGKDHAEPLWSELNINNVLGNIYEHSHWLEGESS